MHDLGLLKSIHPEHLTPSVLIAQLFEVLDNLQKPKDFDLEGLPRITRHIRNLLADKITQSQPEVVYFEQNQSQQLLAS
jgi:predicted glycosyltransferase